MYEEAAKSRALGRAALVAAFLLLAASIAAAIINSLEAVPFVDTSETFSFSYSVGVESSNPAEVAHAAKVQEHWLVGLVAGVAALSLGVIAGVSNRGRAAGVLAIVIVIVTPVVSVITFFAVMASAL